MMFVCLTGGIIVSVSQSSRCTSMPVEEREVRGRNPFAFLTRTTLSRNYKAKTCNKHSFDVSNYARKWCWFWKQ